MKYRNAKMTEVYGVIDCEIDHPVFGWIPYTLDPSDTDQTIDNVALLIAMQGNKDVSEYVAPSPPTPTALATAARAKRNSLLATSDWTQVADAPVDQAAWATYRQVLRDVTTQVGFPETIDWPAVP